MGADAREQEWMARLRAGDHAAFEELVIRETGHLLAVARGILRSDEEAKDCLQDIFLAAFRGLPNFHGDASVSTWLHRIAVNTALMRIRSLRRSREQLVEQGDLDQAWAARGLEQGPLQWCPEDPETALVQRQTEAVVATSLGRISQEHRSVIVLRDFDELSTAQAAAKLGTSPDALKMRLHRARVSLRDVLTYDGTHQDVQLLPAPSGGRAQMVAA